MFLIRHFHLKRFNTGLTFRVATLPLFLISPLPHMEKDFDSEKFVNNYREKNVFILLPLWTTLAKSMIKEKM